MTHRRQRNVRHNVRQRRGSTFVLMIIFLVVMIGFLAFAIDIGHIAVAEAELQNACDAAARSGARGLYHGPQSARDAAIFQASKNTVAKNPNVISSQDVEVGVWDEDSAEFTPLTAGFSAANAVRVTSRQTIGLYFGRIISSDNRSLEAQSIAQMTPKICGGFVGINNAYVGSLVDSYDSDIGSYSSQTPGHEGDVCSNGSIQVANGRINGDANSGIGKGVNVSGLGHITGDVKQHLPYYYPPIIVGDAATNNDNHLLESKYVKNVGGLDAISIASSKSTSFPGGVLYLEYLSVNGEFRITGPTTIYVRDRCEIAGNGIVNLSQIPSNLMIYLLNTDGHVSKITGGGDFYGVFYGPTSDLRISGDANFFGSAVVWDFQVSTSGEGSGAHFDQSIRPFHQDLVKPKLVQ